MLNAAPTRPLDELAGLVDILLVNAVEAEMLGSPPIEDLDAASAAARQLLNLAPTVVVTAGAAGVVAATEGDTWTARAHPVERAQTHGAGDVFAGAMAARLAHGSPLEQALRYANAAAALHVGRAGSAAMRSGLPTSWRCSDRTLPARRWTTLATSHRASLERPCGRAVWVSRQPVRDRS